MIVSAEKISTIIDYFGSNHQRLKAAEELSELMTLILQDANRNGKVPVSRIVEEIADVYVMLAQIEMIYFLDSRDIQPIIDWKIDRTIRRMEDGEQWEAKARSISKIAEKEPTDSEEQWNVLPSRLLNEMTEKVD